MLDKSKVADLLYKSIFHARCDNCRHHTEETDQNGRCEFFRNCDVNGSAWALSISFATYLANRIVYDCQTEETT